MREAFKGYMIAYTLFAGITGGPDALYVYIPEAHKPFPMWIARGYLHSLAIVYILALVGYLFWLLFQELSYIRCFARLFWDNIKNAPH